MFDLLHFQHNLVSDTVEHMNQGGAPCLVSPTGSGKTVMLAEIARLYRQWGYDVILAAHRNEIIKQIAASCLKHCEEPIGFYTAERATEDRGIVVTMMPTLAKRRDAVPSFRGRVLLLDEAHHIQARTYQEVVKEIQPCFFAGATATPITPTGQGLGKFGITKLVIGPQPKQLMDEGHLCSYKMFAGDDAVVDTSGVPISKGDYSASAIEQRIIEVQGDFLRDLLRFNPELHPTIAVTISVSHAYMLAEDYRSRGISAEVVIGKTSARDRDYAFERFTNGDLKVIVSVALIDEGLDLPAATCLQLVRPTRSLRLWKQLIGRVLRIDRSNPDKQALIIDHGNCWKNLPLPHEPIDWTLEGKIKVKKARLFVDENNEVAENPDKPEKPDSVLVARGDKRELVELNVESIYLKRIQKRVKAAKKNLFLVESKNFTPAILWPFANNPEGLDDGQRRRIERALYLPWGHCGNQADEACH